MLPDEATSLTRDGSTLEIRKYSSNPFADCQVHADFVLSRIAKVQFLQTLQAGPFQRAQMNRNGKTVSRFQGTDSCQNENVHTTTCNGPVERRQLG
jgi:hypothetical protein